MALQAVPQADHWRDQSPTPVSDLRSILAARAESGTGRLHVFDRATDGFLPSPQKLILDRAFVAGHQMLEAGLRAGQVALVACPAPDAALIAFLGAVSVGVIPAVVAVRPAFDGPKAMASRIARLYAELPDVGATVLPATAKSELVARLGGRVVLLDPGPPAGDHPPLGPADPGATAYIQLTSGTTSHSKPVVVTYGTLAANLDAIVERLEPGPDETFLSWLPLYHDMGLVGFPLLGLALDVDVALMTPYDFLSDASRWIRGLGRIEATMTASPTFGLDYAARMADRTKIDGTDLSALSRLYCAAEPVDPETLQRFHGRFGAYGLDRGALKTGYGMAEAGLMVTMPHLDDAGQVISIDVAALSDLDRVEVKASRSLLAPRPVDSESTLDLVALGPPATGTELWLARADGSRIHDEDTCGEITIRGTSLSPGYLLPDGSIDDIDPEGFGTGDIGLIHDGQLYVIERLKNIIIRNGQNYAARSFEDVLARVAGLRSDQVLVVDSDIRPGAGKIVALVELDRGQAAEPITQAVIAHLDDFEPPLDELALLRPGGLPRTTSGKKRPAEVRARLGSGGLKIVERIGLHAATSNPGPQLIDLASIEVSEQVTNLVASHARRRGVERPVHEALRLGPDLGFDSLAIFELAMATEAALGIELHDRDMASVRTVADLCTIANRARLSPSPSDLGITRSLALSAEPVPQMLNTVEAQHGRQVLIDGRWVTDFASCNYLGLDLHPDVLGAVAPALERWGVHPSWTRAVASPAPYSELERRLAALVGAPDAVVFPTVSLLHMGVLPRLAEGGTIVVDEAAHQSLRQAADLARSVGARVFTARHDDLDDLDAQLATAGAGPRVVAVDGVYSMAGSYAPLPEIVELAERYDATVYVDDAHGFGIIGEGPGPERPYGSRGNGVVRFHGLDYSRIVYVAGLSKAYSSMAAFVTARNPEERRRLERSSTMVFSGPIPTASLASALAGLDVNDREGDAIRSRLRGLTSQLVDGARQLEFGLDNETGFPIVNAIVGGIEAVHHGCELLWDAGLLVTPAVFPAAPLHRGGVRFTPTAANTADEVAQAIAALAQVRAAIAPVIS